ncbi:hypothetical protein [Alkaliphilus pronyensis]|nr:hypothetical protein [Alkaliphilus pronyensis]
MGCIFVKTSEVVKGTIGKYVLWKLKDEFAVVKNRKEGLRVTNL